MKLAKQEFTRAALESPLVLFEQGIKAQETREKYTRTLRMVLCKIFEDILEGTFEQRAQMLVERGKKDPQWARDLMLSLSRKLRERTQLAHDDPEYLNPVSFGGYFKPIKKLFDMNDVVISWKRINVTYPELDNVSESRGWERHEIQKMLKFANNAMDRAIILIAASSGIRAGGFDLQWRDLTPIYKIDDKLVPGPMDGEPVCAMLYVYSGSSERYPAFITPEAYDAIMHYKMDWIRQVGREPKPEDPLFKQNSPQLFKANKNSIKKRVDRMITKAGLRNSQCFRRHEVPIMNGFRRFWNKTCKESVSQESSLASLIKKEYMMGHRGLIKLDRNYFKTRAMELAAEYLHTVLDLTMDDSIRLHKLNEIQSQKIRQFESEKDARISDLEKIVDNLVMRIS